ncbi:MAG: DUF1343 domain-containing protein [Candidatus Marinimicrobia bacterium]|nr:DUF1343 domain-containing protein [Candidatus Neomarinimicrobiota bacterium]MBL7059449.1 DUF1343 domain-containing protein [Candidatus Neomarinimicrobiota bacterium]
MRNIYRIFITLFVTGSILLPQNFKYSKIMGIPDLSFVPQIFTGLDVLEQMDCRSLKDRTIGVVCNQTSVNHRGNHLLDILDKHNINVRYVFLPEHGLTLPDDGKVILSGEEGREPVTGAKLIDTFGRYVKPPSWAMNEIDLVLVDIQDTGVRYSTYITTVTKVMEAAGEWGIPVMVLDRPNPLGGLTMSGPIPRLEYQSFEAYHLVPIRHGLTIGEYAVMVNETGWIKDLVRADLTVIPLANWSRAMWMDDENENWNHPAPDLNDVETILTYTGSTLMKGTNISIGQGTHKRYKIAGAPWISGTYLAEHLTQLELPGVRFTSIRFIPKIHADLDVVPRYVGEECSGVEIRITDKYKFEPIRTAAAIIFTIHHLYPREFQWEKYDYIDKLFGSSLLRTMVAQGRGADELSPLWGYDILRFSEFRNKFLLYP